MDNNMPVISAKNLNLWYGDFKALKGISLDVGEREITALIGPSGEIFSTPKDKRTEDYISGRFG